MSSQTQLEYLHLYLLSLDMYITIPHAAACILSFTVAIQAAPFTTSSSSDSYNLFRITKRNPEPLQLTLPVDFPDPSIVQYNNTSYAFATNNGININVQFASKSSTSAIWSSSSGYDALPNVGSWSSGLSSSNGWLNHNVWAPNVVQNDFGQWVMYYSASIAYAPSFHCVGVAASSTIQGPYTPYGSDPLLCPIARGGAIDASGFRDADGSRWIVYKVDGNSRGNGGICGNTVPPIQSTPIMLQRVAGDAVTLLGPPVQILDRDDSDGPLVEAPALVRAPGGWYVLFFSSNCYDSEQYDVGYAISMNITGMFFVKKTAQLAV